MKEVSNHDELLQAMQNKLFLFVHTRFCGTCQLARKMLVTIEEKANQDIFYELNAAFFPEFMQEQKVTSVPCMLIISNGKVKERIYAFQSVQHIFRTISVYI